MSFSKKCAILTALVALMMLAASVDASDPLPTADDVRSSIDSGDFPSAVRDANRLLTLKGDLAVGVDRVEMYMLRGEAQLALKLRDAASTSFTAAAKEATDPNKSAVATATAILIQKSPGLHYTPKHKAAIDAAATTQPIDILSEDGRKTAFVALYADERITVSANVKTATSATSLAPIVSALKSLHRVQSLEIAATGSDVDTHGAVKDVQAHATSLLTSALSTIAAQVQQISVQAHALVQNTDSSGVVHTRQAGLSDAAISSLKQAISQAQRISDAATDLATLADASDTSGVTAQAKGVSDQANALLATNWSASETTSGAPARGSSFVRH
jgi:hypothetical protein